MKNIKEVREIDNGDDVRVVNKLLSEGWVILRIRTYVKKESSDLTVENPIYILGLPSR